MEDEGSRIFGSGNWARENQDKGKEGKGNIRLADSKRS